MNNSVYAELFETILSRKQSAEEGSYTAYLFGKGLDKILKKVGEECSEVIISAKNAQKDETVNEICDLFYHVFVLMAEQGIPLEAIEQELITRTQKANNLKTMRTTDKNT